MAVDQSRSHGRAFGIDGGGRARDVLIVFFADRINDAVNRDHGVGVENGMFEVSAQKKANVADDQLVSA